MDWVKEKRHQASLQRKQIQAQGAVTNQGNNLRHDSDETITRFYNFSTLTHKLSWLAGGMALGSMLVIMVWKTELVDVGNDGNVSNFLAHKKLHI